MRKKPDILLLLAVLVVPGVVLSNLVISKQDSRVSNFSTLKAHYSRLLLENNPKPDNKHKPDNSRKHAENPKLQINHTLRNVDRKFISRAIAHNDSLKKQTR